MRLLLFTLILFLSVPSFVHGQTKSPDEVKISYSAVNKPLGIVLNELVALSNVNIIYSESKFDAEKKVDIQVKNESLGRVLKIILKPYQMDYEVIGNNVVIVSQRSEEYQKSITLSGYIRDKATLEVLPFAHVYSAAEKIGISANENGYFSLTLPRKSYRFVASYTGYKADTLALFLSDNSEKNFYLSSSAQLNEIEITSDKINNQHENIGREKLSKGEINRSTYLLGESDINRVLAFSPGIATGADGFGGMSVRGGSYDQNLILYDGVPIHHVGHALGLVSIFNSSAIQDVSLYKGDFSPSYGGRLSSVLDVRTREGDYRKYGGEVSFSTIASKLTLEGPIVKEKASFLISLRRTFADAWIKSLSKYQIELNGDSGQSSYRFYDINAKVNFSLGKRNKVFISYYTGKDDFSNRVDSDKRIEDYVFSDRTRNILDWGSEVLSLHLNSQLSRKAFSRFIAYRSRWDFNAFNHEGFFVDRDTSVTEIYQTRLEASEILTEGLKYEVDLAVGRSWKIHTGLGANRQSFQPKFRSLNALNNGLIFPNIPDLEEVKASVSDVTIANREGIFYINNDVHLGGGLSLNVGLHSSVLEVDQTYYVSHQPRLNLIVDGKYTDFKAYASKMRQYNHLLSDNQLGFPSDLWVTTTEKLRPADAWVIGGGLNARSTDVGSINAELYVKWLDQIVSLNEGEVVPFDSQENNWESYVPRGTGQAFGAEFSWLKNIGVFNFDFNYTWSKSTRRFADLNNGMEFAYRFDRTHMINCNVKANLGPKVDFGLNFVFGKGNPVTIPTSEIVEVVASDGKKFLSVVYAEKNNARLKDYVRVDVGFNFYNTYKFGHQKFYLGVYNLLNTNNPLFLDIRRNRFDPDIYELHSVSVIPILPSINYALSF